MLINNEGLTQKNAKGSDSMRKSAQKGQTQLVCDKKIQARYIC